MMPTLLYLLDTNTVSDIASQRSKAARVALAQAARYSTIAISTVTLGEIYFGLARKPQAWRLHAAIEVVLSGLQILPWDTKAALAYGDLRLHMAQKGKSLSATDTLIAAHAIATGATLVTRDAAFSQIEALRTPINWATDL